ncbi:MAG: hypothetical protein Q8K64_02150 [Sediminibacterium sp.]|nr:hypothetical protein [Sediminibacterium sp.]
MKNQLFLMIFFVEFLSSCTTPKTEKPNKEIAFINENFFSLIDTSVVYPYRSFFGSFDDFGVTTRDSLAVSVWHELKSMQEHVNYLPRVFIENKLEKYLSVFEDTILKQNNSTLDLKKITNTDLIRLVSRNKYLKKMLVPGTVGDIVFYRVLFDKHNKYAMTLIYNWTGPKSAVLWLFLFEHQNGKWKVILQRALEKS